MIILGIDPGTAITGYGLIKVLDNGNLQSLEHGVIRTSADCLPEERLLTIHTQLREIILLHKPECCAVEKIFFQKNVKTAMAVGQARGVVLLTLAQLKIPVFHFTPMEIKQAVTGYGGADKKQIQQMVKFLLNLEAIPKPDDAADALAAAICHANGRKLRTL